MLSLIITIIILLILATVAMSTFKGDGIIKNSQKAVDMAKVESMREEIKMAIINKIVKNDREITIEQIIEQLEKQDIIKAGDCNIETGQVKTQPDGYVYEIKEKANGDWEVTYIGNGELTLPELLIALSPNTTGITNSVTITMTAKAESGISSYTLPKGTEQTVASGTKEITTTYTATENGTYTFTVTNGNGKTESQSITIDNILEGVIVISASPTTPTKEKVTVKVTWPSEASSAIKEIQVGEGSWQVCTGEISSVEVMVNCTVKARLKDSTNQTGNVASVTIANIDKTAPTAPTITGGSTSWATSRTISVSTASTDVGSGVSYYQYYTTSSSTAPTTSTTATGNVGSTANDKSKTFNTNYNAYYVYFRAVDAVGNVGAWSGAQRLYIDVNKPTVTAKQASLTITQGQSYAMSNYFTVSQNGNAGISSTTYKEGSTTVSNTNTLSVGTHTITCTVTKANGLSNSASVTVVVNSAVPVEETTLYYSSKGDDGESEKSTITIPTGVNIIKVTCWAYSEVDLFGVDISSDTSRWGYAAPDWGDDMTYISYVKVTPGKTYNITVQYECGGDGDVTVTYSQSINQQKPDITDL